MKLLLTSGGVTNTSIREALVDLLGKPIEEVVPHLTVGHDVPEDQLRAAEAKVLPHLPIRTEITVVGLWCGTDAHASWYQMTDFPLG